MKKQFQLDDWLKDKSQKVVTRCGFPVRIVCTDVKRKDYPILALVERDDQEEYQSFTKDGRFSLYNPLHDNFDLFIETADEVSEDEKVRKELIDAVQGLWDNDALPMPLSVKRKDEWLAWLEKQGTERKITHEEICKSYGIPDIGEFSDGYHTFNGLYKQRMILFAVLVKTYKDRAWKSWKHEDGLDCFGGGWFIVGIDTPEGTYTYHYEAKDWNRFDCQILEKAKHWDGHNESDVERLFSLVSNTNKDKRNIEGISPNWSEEDEKMMAAIEHHLNNCGASITAILWLKSLKGRVGCEANFITTKKWSEEDETGLTNTIIMLKEGASLHFNKKDITKAVDWLKSLRPQNHWKPSEGDIIILEKVFKGELEPKIFQATLQGILEQLKKLKGEV